MTSKLHRTESTTPGPQGVACSVEGCSRLATQTDIGRPTCELHRAEGLRSGQPVDDLIGTVVVLDDSDHCGGCGCAVDDRTGWTHCSAGGPECGDRCPDCGTHKHDAE